MNPQSVAEWLNGLSLAERAKALTRVSYQLTIHARDYLLASAEQEKSAAARKLMGINELQHKLTSQIGHYLEGEQNAVYPADVFSRILSETATQYGIRATLTTAMEYVMTRTPVQP
jgi:hypothetical protein